MWIIAIAVAAFLLYYYRNKAVGMPIVPHASTPPGPHFLPFLGHLPIVIRNYKRIYDLSYEMMTEQAHRTYAFLIPFSPPFIQTHDPKNIEFILKTKFNSFIKGTYISDRMKDILGNGIFVVDGHEWYFQRKTASHIFTAKKFKEYVEKVFVEKRDLLLSSIDDKNSAIDVHQMLYKFTLDVFGKIGFGTDLDCLKHDIPFGKSLERCQSVISYRFHSPTWKIEEILFFWRRNQILTDIKILRSFALGLIEKRKAEGDIQQNESSDLLTLFMKAKDADGKPLPDSLLCDFMLNFIIAGRDTTAQALSWTIFELSQYPDVQKKLLKEIQENIGDNTPTYEEVKHFKYAKAIFQEALRLHPSVPMNSREVLSDEILPDGTFVKKGSKITWCPYAMGRYESIWGPDAKTFNPDRWLDTSKVYSPFEYPVFHAGPRTCLGKTLAELEAVFVIVSLYQRYKIEALPNQSISYKDSITLPMDAPFLCVFTERK